MNDARDEMADVDEIDRSEVALRVVANWLLEPDAMALIDPSILREDVCGSSAAESVLRGNNLDI